MDTNVLMLIAALVIGVGAYLYYKRNKTYLDIVVSEPAVKRTDLYYGYYSCDEEQVAETKDHINLFMDSQFDGPDKCAQNILDAGVDAVLDVQFQLFEKSGNTLVVRPTASQNLVDFLDFLQYKGALKFVKIIYPADEANNTTTIEYLTQAVNIVKSTVRMYPELDGVKLGMIYAADKSFIGQGMFDYVGFDDYDKKSSILTGQYRDLKASLLPHQKTILVPGGAFGQDPTPFVNFAQNNAEVGIVMPFLWFDDTTGNAGAPGIRLQESDYDY